MGTCPKNNQWFYNNVSLEDQEKVKFGVAGKYLGVTAKGFTYSFGCKIFVPPGPFRSGLKPPPVGELHNCSKVLVT